jgi:hypothetical protein
VAGCLSLIIAIVKLRLWLSASLFVAIILGEKKNEKAAENIFAGELGVDRWLRDAEGNRQL